jgi:hypothetical protein
MLSTHKNIKEPLHSIFRTFFSRAFCRRLSCLRYSLCFKSRQSNQAPRANISYLSNRHNNAPAIFASLLLLLLDRVRKMYCLSHHVKDSARKSPSAYWMVAPKCECVGERYLIFALAPSYLILPHCTMKLLSSSSIC